MESVGHGLIDHIINIGIYVVLCGVLIVAAMELIFKND